MLHCHVIDRTIFWMLRSWLEICLRLTIFPEFLNLESVEIDWMGDEHWVFFRKITPGSTGSFFENHTFKQPPIHLLRLF